MYSPNTYNLYYNDEYTFNASTSGIEIYDVDTESAVKYVTHSGGINSVWASSDIAYLGTTTAGIYTLGLDYITSVSGVVDLSGYLVSFKSYPEITDNHVKYIHGAGDYMCVVTASGVDHFNFGHSDSYYRSYTTFSDYEAGKCWQTSTGRFYYTAYPSDFVEGWSYNKSVTLSSSTTMNNYQIRITLDSANFDYSKADEDGDDIRFYNLSGNSLPYWIEDWDVDGTSIIWVKVLYSGTSEIIIYYGNPDATAESSGDDTFDFFDDFDDGTIDPAKWQDTTGFSESGGYLWGSNTTYRIRSQSAWTGNYILETRHYSADDAQDGYQAGGWRGSTSNGYNPLLYSGNRWYTRNDGAWHGPTTFTYLDQWIRIKTVAIGASSYATITRESGGSSTHDDSNSGLASEYIALGQRNDNAYLGQAYDGKWDWLFVRKYAATEPTGSLGDEESIDYKFNAVYTHQCDWDFFNVGYIYETTGSGNLFFSGPCKINDIAVTEGTSIHRIGGRATNNIIVLATSNEVVVIEEKQGDEENSRYKHYLVEA